MSLRARNAASAIPKGATKRNHCKGEVWGSPGTCPGSAGMWESPWDMREMPRDAGMCWDVPGDAQRCWEMLCHARRCWDKWGHARNSPSIGRSSRQQLCPNPWNSPLQSHPKAFLTKRGWKGRAGLSPWNNPGDLIPFPQRHMKGFVLSSLERGWRFPSPFPASPDTDPTFPLEGAGCLYPPLPGQLGGLLG